MTLVRNILQVLFLLCFYTIGVAQQNPEEPFKVGVITALTGNLSTYGEAIRNGFLLAQEEYESSTDGVEFIFEDSGYAGPMAVNAMQKLITADKVRLIFNWGCGPSEAVAPIAESRQIPLFSTCPDENHSRDRRFVFRYRPAATEYAQVLAQHVRDMKFRSIAVLTVENPYFNSILNALTSELKGDVEFENVDTFLPGMLDFRTSIAKIKRSRHQAVLSFLLPGQVAQFHLQSKEQKMDLPVLGSEVHDNKSEMELGKGSLDGVVLATTSVSPEFRARYVKKFGTDVRIQLAATAFDFATLVNSLFQGKDRKLSPEIMLERFVSAKPFTGVCGEVSFTRMASNSRGFSFPVLLRKIEGNSSKAYGKLVG